MTEKTNRYNTGESFKGIDQTVDMSTESATYATTDCDGFWGTDIFPTPEEVAEAASKFWKKEGIPEFSYFDKGREFDCERHAPSIYAILPSALVDDDNIIEAEFNQIDEIDRLDEIDGFDGLDYA